MCAWQVTTGRLAIPGKVGAPERDRTRGVADKPKKSHKSKTDLKQQRGISKKSKKQAVARSGIRQRSDDSLHTDRDKGGYDGDAALRQLKKFGAKEDWIVKVYPPDDIDEIDTVHWFMRVLDGLTETIRNETDMKKSDIVIKSAVWLETNSLTAIAKGYPPESCDIEFVKSYGPQSFFEKRYPQLLQKQPLPRQKKNQNPPQTLGSARVFDSSSSDSDGPISKGARRAAIAAAASAAQPAAQPCQRPKRNCLTFDGAAWNIGTQ